MRKEKTKQNEVESLEITSWKDLIGFEKDQARLRELVRDELLPTVLLFEGRAGIGKRSLLFFLAALHFCENSTACGQCNPCQLVAANKHPDLLVVKGDGEVLKASSVSDLGDFLNYSTQSDSLFARRILLLIDAEYLTTAAVNKLLKTLEEPSPSSRILISSSRKKYLLPTLLSRCVQWHLRPPAANDVETILVRECANLSEILSREELSESIARFGNSPGEVLNFLGQKLYQKSAEELMRCRKVGEVLSVAESFRHENEAKLSYFLPEFEYALNLMYKHVLSTRDFSHMGDLFHRRKFLKELKKLVNDQKIPLNSQMVIENLGFYNLKIPART